MDLLTGDLSVSDPKNTLLLLLLALLLVNAIRSFSQKAQQYVQSMHGELISNELALKMMERAGQADLEYFDNPDYYDKLTVCMRDAPVISHLIWNVLAVLSSLVSFILSFSILCRVNALYGICMLCAAIPSSIAALRYTKLIYHLSLEQINGERQKGYLQNLAVDRRFAQDLRIFNAAKNLRERYQRLWRELFIRRKSMIRSRSVWTSLLECLPELVLAGVGLDLALNVLAGAATVGDYFLYTGLLSQLWGGIYMLSNAVMQIYDNQLKVNNLQSLDQYKNRLQDTGTRHLERVSSIEFKHVSFSYPSSGKQVLNDVSFSIAEGERVALVGLNGSGKSTLIKLLLRMYDIDSGMILINGHDIREFSLKELRRNFSVYFQDEPSYSFTLRENLTIADLERSENDEHIRQAFIDSNAEDILGKAQHGLDTYLTRIFDKDGMELSGGQYQKLALARTFFRRHTALILDEPSSNLDPMAEHRLFEKLRDFTQGKTVLFTSHRLTNISLADRIVVLENGRVLEDGTQAELLRQDGRYAELFRYQQARYQVSKEGAGIC